jgi:UDP-N-acetylglucosamine diphosphorylase / glucose-1-phosphate thymidylyltransferase / UDP-N-acetylgalactosamine diphosphorylase / glucosamine-1-phosphate N-acetyltransferase / galactosamine-1-phosphate N-acetyltransferase
MLASDFFALPASLALFASSFPEDVAPWEWLTQIGPALAACSAPRPTFQAPPGVVVEGPAWIDPSVRFVGAATLIGPVWIGANTEVRPGAYVRGNVIVGEGAVLGNSCEFKNCLLMDRVQVPHFSYVGDSILGNAAHLGAGVICSNLRLDQKPISVHAEGKLHRTGLRKLGAIVGEQAEVGCNAVLQPGTILGRRALVMPLTAFAGYLPAKTIAYHRNKVATLPRRD